jgi:hypothetical protein
MEDGAVEERTGAEILAVEGIGACGGSGRAQVSRGDEDEDRARSRRRSLTFSHIFTNCGDSILCHTVPPLF